MAHFAEIDKDNKVVRVIVAEPEFIDSGAIKGTWIQTSYNTEKGEYKKGANVLERTTEKARGSEKDRKARDRKNFAGVGFSYDPESDSFIPPQPFPSWKLKKRTGEWEPPKIRPKGKGRFDWDEDLLDWKEIK